VGPPGLYYELKIDTDGDYVEDITYRATFPIGPNGKQHVQVAELTGAEATSRHAKGTIITPRHAPIGEIVELRGGIKLFAGKRLDPFFNFIPNPVATTKALATGTFPNYNALRPDSDSFASSAVCPTVLRWAMSSPGTAPTPTWTVSSTGLQHGSPHSTSGRSPTPSASSTKPACHLTSK
jgi:hypothetical protein